MLPKQDQKKMSIIRFDDFRRFGCPCCGFSHAAGIKMIVVSVHCFSIICTECSGSCFVVKFDVVEIPSFIEEEYYDYTQKHPFNLSEPVFFTNQKMSDFLSLYSSAANSNNREIAPPLNSAIIALNPEEEDVINNQEEAV